MAKVNGMRVVYGLIKDLNLNLTLPNVDRQGAYTPWVHTLGAHLLWFKFYLTLQPPKQTMLSSFK